MFGIFERLVIIFIFSEGRRRGLAAKPSLDLGTDEGEMACVVITNKNQSLKY